MKTRRQAKLESSHVSVSPLQKKKARGQKKGEADTKKEDRPNKRTKKDASKSPSPIANKKTENKRGRKKK